MVKENLNNGDDEYEPPKKNNESKQTEKSEKTSNSKYSKRSNKKHLPNIKFKKFYDTKKEEYKCSLRDKKKKKCRFKTKYIQNLREHFRYKHHCIANNQGKLEKKSLQEIHSNKYSYLFNTKKNKYECPIDGCKTQRAIPRSLCTHLRKEHNMKIKNNGNLANIPS